MDRKVVIDACAAIKTQRLDKFGGELYTTGGVIREIRDENARAYLKTLPSELRVREPTAQDILFTKNFAKATGDLGFLSQNDMELIALTVMLHREAGGTVRERPAALESGAGTVAFDWAPAHASKPTPAATEAAVGGAAAPVDEAAAAVSHFAAPSGQSVAQVLAAVDKAEKEDGPATSSAAVAAEAEPAAAEEPPAAAAADAPAAAVPAAPAVAPAATAGLSWAERARAAAAAPKPTPATAPKPAFRPPAKPVAAKPVPVKKEEPAAAAPLPEVPQSDEWVAVGKKGANCCPEEAKDAEEEAEAEGEEENGDETDSEDGSSAGEWVTSDNMSHFGMGIQPAEDVKATCATADYSVQNVLLQMGITPLTFDGYAVRSVKLWGLVCRACQHFTRDTQKVFCPKCGNDTVVRVPIIVDENGQATVLNTGRPLRKKGTVYSIPKPQGGRSWKPIYAEDDIYIGGRDRQLRHAERQQDKERQMRDPFNEDNATRSWYQRGKAAGGGFTPAGEGPRLKAGLGRVNPNANNYKHKTAGRKKK